MAKTIGCINCGSVQVTRTGDSFKCGRCDYEWTVEFEQQHAAYIRTTQGRGPAESIADPEPTLEDALATAVNGDGGESPKETGAGDAVKTRTEPIVETGEVEAAQADAAEEEAQPDEQPEPDKKADEQSKEDAKPSPAKSGSSSRRKSGRSK